MPTQRSEDGAWPHPSRLPLGGGWKGHCTAPGHEGVLPGEGELQQFCNLGYAASCPHWPGQHTWDAVRFSVARDQEQSVHLWYVCEAAHQPGEHGKLEYNVERGLWAARHRDARIQKMAECYLESYLLRRTRPAAAACPSS